MCSAVKLVSFVEKYCRHFGEMTLSLVELCRGLAGPGTAPAESRPRYSFKVYSISGNDIVFPGVLNCDMLYFQLMDEMGRWITASGSKMGNREIGLRVLLTWLRDALVKDGRAMAHAMSNTFLDVVNTLSSTEVLGYSVPGKFGLLPRGLLVD